MAENTFLPSVKSGAGPSPVGETNDPVPALGYNERIMMEFIKGSLEQRRTEFIINDTLMQTAHDKARRMAHERWEGHTDPQGESPNELLRRFGYDLPSFYFNEGVENPNGVESLYYGGNADNPATVFNWWMDSPAHKAHLMGMGRFFSNQKRYGIAYYYLADSIRKHYWVFHAAHLPGDPY